MILIVTLLVAIFSSGCGIYVKNISSDRLQEELEAANRRIDNLTAIQNDLVKKYEEVVGLLEGMKGREDSQKGAPLAFLKRRVSRQAADPEEVAFTAELTNKLENVAVGTTIVFDTAIHNTGTFYDATTGIFTCPTSGLYLFSIFIESGIHREAVVDLMMDGTSFLSAISQPSIDGEDDTGGNLVLLDVRKGARIWVETVSISSQSFWPTFTTFSGVMVHKHTS